MATRPVTGFQIRRPGKAVGYESPVQIIVVIPLQGARKYRINCYTKLVPRFLSRGAKLHHHRAVAGG